MPAEAAGKRFTSQVNLAITRNLLTGDTAKERLTSYKDIVLDAQNTLHRLSRLQARLDESARSRMPPNMTKEQEAKFLREKHHLPDVTYHIKHRVRREDGTVEIREIEKKSKFDVDLVDELNNQLRIAFTNMPRVIQALKGARNNSVMDHPNQAYYNLINLLGPQMTVQYLNERKEVKDVNIANLILEQVKTDVRAQPVPGFSGLQLLPRNALNMFFKAYFINRHMALAGPDATRIGVFIWVQKRDSKDKPLPKLYISGSFIHPNSPVLNELRQALAQAGVSQEVINKALQPDAAKSKRVKVPPPAGSVRITAMISRLKSALTTVGNQDLDTYLMSQANIQAAVRQNLAAELQRPLEQVNIQDYMEIVGNKIKMKAPLRKAYKLAVSDLDAAALKFSAALRGWAETIEQALEKNGVTSPRK